MKDPPLRIGLNGIPLLSPLTGIGHYTSSLARAIGAESDIELTLFYGRHWSHEIRQAPIARIENWKRLVKALVPAPYTLMRAVQQLPFATGARNLDLFHDPTGFPLAGAAATVSTVHDLTWERFPEAHPPQRVRAFSRMFGRALSRSSHLICDSEFVRAELIERHGVAPEKVTAIPLAARATFSPLRQSTPPDLSGHGLFHRQYLLAVGTIEPRKNLDAVVRAHAALPGDTRKRFPLVIVGMKGWLTSRLESLIEAGVRSREIRVLGYVDDEELARLYASARMLIYPSLYEGFGLPPLEAMASGTPVITSNVSSLPEVVGDAGIQVDPHDVDALRDAIRLLSEDDERWEALRSAGLARAAQFSWERCARETLAVYQKVLA